MALAEFTVMFRELFEISLIIGIMLAYLQKSGKNKLAWTIWAGAGLAGVASVLSALAFESLAGGFERWEPLFEGVTLLLAAAMVTWLITWMFGQRNVKEGIKKGMEQEMHSQDEMFGLLGFAFIAVLREGIEIVLFLAGIRISSGGLSVLGAVAGGAVALALAWAVFRSLVRLNLALFFKATGIILVLLAGGLVSQGVHELQEAGVLPSLLGGPVYDINPPAGAGGPYPLLHEKGVVGGMLKTTIGLDYDPSVEQLMAHGAYFIFVYAAWLHIGKRKNGD